MIISSTFLFYRRIEQAFHRREGLHPFPFKTHLFKSLPLTFFTRRPSSSFVREASLILIFLILSKRIFYFCFFWSISYPRKAWTGVGIILAHIIRTDRRACLFILSFSLRDMVVVLLVKTKAIGLMWDLFAVIFFNGFTSFRLVLIDTADITHFHASIYSLHIRPCENNTYTYNGNEIMERTKT